MTPVDPLKKAIGKNTADSTVATPTSAPVISLIERTVASIGHRCSSRIRRSTFSTTTIASSTSRPNDSTKFIRISIEEVVKTLIEAIVLVVLVMFIFLQRWRATLIPVIAVPVVLLGTFCVLNILGYSINTLTMFGLVLSFGLLVDDAIDVVENVERLMREEH